MARLEEKVCPGCHELFTGTELTELCNRCQKIADEAAKANWLREFRGSLTLNERVAKIEECLYHLQKHEHFNILDQRF